MKAMLEHDEAARKRGVAAVSALAFEIAVGDCAAAVAGAEFREISSLLLTYATRFHASKGTQRTILRMLQTAGYAYERGAWVETSPASVVRTVDFPPPVGRVTAMSFPSAEVITARSDLALEGPPIEGKRVVVVEDGPTLTHGGMTYGAGVVAARRFGAAELVDPEPVAVGSIKAVLQRYPGLEPLVPAMGYGETQMRELKETLERVDADLVLVATPIDLGSLLKLDKPVTRVRYELAQVSGRPLREIVEGVLAR